MLNILDIQTKLVEAALPSGYERPCGELLAELARPYCDEMWFTPTGSLVCHKKGEGKKLMFAAHMDIIGLIVTNINDKGYISFTNIGGHNPAALIHTTVRFENGIRGVIKLKNQGDWSEKAASAITLPDLYIDIAATSREEAESMVKVGDLAMFDSKPALVGDDCLMGPYCDDLCSCIVLLMAMEQLGETTSDLYFVFTVQEEVGLKGAITSTACIEPHFGIAIDVCPTGDDPSAGMDIPVAVGKGPTVKIKDMSVICSPKMVTFMQVTAEENGIPYQNEIILGGGTDTAGIMHTGKGAQAGCMSIPCRNIHSPCELVSIRDMENGAKLIAACAMATL